MLHLLRKLTYPEIAQLVSFSTTSVILDPRHPIAVTAVGDSARMEEEKERVRVTRSAREEKLKQTYVQLRQ